MRTAQGSQSERSRGRSYIQLDALTLRRPHSLYQPSRSLSCPLSFLFFPMHNFLRTLFRHRPSKSHKTSRMTTTRSVSGGGIAAALYACTITPPSSLGAVPEDNAAKAHHLKDGKGFTNPWPSWQEMSGPQVAMGMIK